MRQFLLFFLCLGCFGGTNAQTTFALPSPHSPAFNAYFQDPANRPVIEGRILNLPAGIKLDSLIGYAAVALPSTEQQQLPATVAADGTFTIELPFSNPVQEVWFWQGNNFYAALLVRTRLSIELDYAQLTATESNQWLHPGVTYSGPDGSLTRARNQQILTENTAGLNMHLALMEPGKNSAEKQLLLDSLYVETQQLDDKILADLTSADAAILRNNRLTEYFGLSNVLYWDAAMPEEHHQRYLAHEPLVVSNSAHDFYSYFAVVLKNEARQRVEKELNLSRLEAYAHPMATDYFLEKVDRDFAPARADLLKLFLEDKDPVLNAEILDKSLATMTTPWCRAVQQRIYARRQAELAKLTASLATKVDIVDKKELGAAIGSLDFGADLYVTAKDLSGEQLLAKIRGAFPGKALYLDFWAVWCGPCLGELPFSAKLHAATHELPVEYLYLCTESGGDQQKWQNLIANHRVGGTHLFVSEPAHSELMKLFSGRGYPTYVLLLPDGTVKLDVDRPSQLDKDKMAELIGE